MLPMLFLCQFISPCVFVYLRLHACVVLAQDDDGKPISPAAQGGAVPGNVYPFTPSPIIADPSLITGGGSGGSSDQRPPAGQRPPSAAAGAGRAKAAVPGKDAWPAVGPDTLKRGKAGDPPLPEKKETSPPKGGTYSKPAGGAMTKGSRK